MSDPQAPGQDARPLEELLLEHAPGLAGAVRGILGPDADVGEVLQQAFLKAWKWEQRQGPARDRVAWLFVLTMNLARDVRRSHSRRERALPVEEMDPVNLDSLKAEPHQALERGEWLGAARAAIHKLRDAEKEVFLLRVSGQRSFSAIAAALDIPVGTAKTRMRNALRHLRRHLAGFAPEMPAPIDGAAFPAREDES